MALTKSSTIETDWSAVAQNVVGESAIVDVSGSYECTMHIQAGLDSTTAHNGTKFVVQVSGMTTGDEDWADFATFVEVSGTANSEAITNNPLAAGSTTATVADTTGYTTSGWRLIEDGTLVNSELIYQTAYVAATSVSCLDGTTNAHAQNTLLYNVAMTKNIYIPMAVQRVRLVVDNTYHAAGSSLNYKMGITKVTGI